jgi:hypothetical protein
MDDVEVRRAASANLPVKLARQVWRGVLSETAALSFIELNAIRAERDGELLPACTLDDKVRIDQHIFEQSLVHHTDLGNATAFNIKTVVRPLIARQQPRGRIRAEAHDINADHDFQLTESMVELVIIDELQRQRAQKNAAATGHAPYRKRRYG